MSDLPVTTLFNDNLSKQDVALPTTTSFSYGGKEGESFPITNVELPLTAVGVEIDLPKEVTSAGVQIHPTTIPLPQVVSNEGVLSVGHNVSTIPTNGKSVVLPLTNDQIELALKKRVVHSIRWMAEWCVYQVKKIQQTVGKPKH